MQHQIPMEQTHCTKFIESFYCNNPNILYLLAVVDNDNPGMRDNFETCVADPVPMYPVAINKAKAYSKKIIVGVVAAVSFDPKLNKLKGESGVKLCYHNNRDFRHIFQP